MNEQIASSANWDSVRVFLAVADTGSFSRAAQILGVSQPTVGRQLDALEDALGITLLVRSTRGVVLTDRGHELARAAASAGDEMNQFFKIASGAREELRGTVRIAATEIIGTAVLMPMLMRLQRDHEHIEIELLLDNRSANLLRGEADVAVRMFKPEHSELVGRHLGLVPTGLYASRDYLQRYSAPTSIDDLLEHRLIGFDSRGAFSGLFARFDSRLTSDRFAFRSDSLLSHLEAARLGMGIAGLQVEVAKRYSTLQRVLSSIEMPPMPLWLLTHKSIRRGAHVRTVFNRLCKELETYLAAL